MRRLPASGPIVGAAAAEPSHASVSPSAASSGRQRPNRRSQAERAILGDSRAAQVLQAVWSGDPAVVVPSPPGAGKTRLVALLAATLARRADLRVGIAAQTREQAAEIARRLHRLDAEASLIWSAAKPLPDLDGGSVVRGSEVRFPPSGGGILVATTRRWLYARPWELACDVVVVDEAWQATYADVAALGVFAPQVVCVGDPGQIDPVVTGRVSRWRGRVDAPHVPAPVALRAVHDAAVSEIPLRHTWRLGPDTTALIRPAFYPDLAFASKRPDQWITDHAGTRLGEIAAHPVRVTSGPYDPALTAAVTDRVRRLLRGTYRDPGNGTDRPVTDADVAVVCSHVAQAAAVRAALADAPALLIGTANQLQGCERPATVALHPLSGYRDSSAVEFAADTGRACVMLSRHRAHLSLVHDDRIGDLLGECDSAAAGIAAHQAVAAALNL